MTKRVRTALPTLRGKGDLRGPDGAHACRVSYDIRRSEESDAPGGDAPAGSGAPTVQHADGSLRVLEGRADFWNHVEYRLVLEDGSSVPIVVAPSVENEPQALVFTLRGEIRPPAA